MSGTNPSSGANISKHYLGRQPSLSSLEQGLNMISSPPAVAPVTIYPGPGARRVNMAKADLELYERLQHLRGIEAELPTEDEMAVRLAQLRGLPCDNNSRFVALDTRTDHQKAQDLLTQVMEENKLDSQLPDPDSELLERLKKLRADSVSMDLSDNTNFALLNSPSAPHDFTEMEEVTKMLNDAEASVSADKLSQKRHMKSGDVCKDRKQHKLGPSNSSTEEERYSNSSDDEQSKRTQTKLRKKARSTQVEIVEKRLAKDEEEVERIVKLYSDRALRKRNKKKIQNKDLSARYSSEPKHSDTDSSSKLSDSNESTSDSEKLSNSSD